MCKVYTGYCGTSEIDHGLSACTVDNPLAKARGLSLRTGAQTMLNLSHTFGSNRFCYLNEDKLINSKKIDKDQKQIYHMTSLLFSG